MDTLKINAMILALECGALSKDAAVEWADELILKQDEPDEALFDISVSKNVYDAISALKNFGHHPNKHEVTKEAFSLFYEALKSDKATYERVTRQVYDMAFTEYLPNTDVSSQMMCFWDELHDAKLGIYGDTNEVKSEFLRFLRQNGS